MNDENYFLLISNQYELHFYSILNLLVNYFYLEIFWHNANSSLPDTIFKSALLIHDI